MSSSSPDPSSTLPEPSIPPQPAEQNDAEESQPQPSDPEEEEGECGFCLFMKGGGCKDAFISWENCVEEAEKNNQDIVEKCFEITAALKKCMDSHSDYYDPILRAEKAAEAEVAKELEAEKEKIKEDEKSLNVEVDVSEEKSAGLEAGR